MKLRTKTIITVFVISLLIFAALQIITVFVLQPSFLSLEQQESTQKINQAKNILEYRNAELAVKVADYAFWDDTYNFVQNQNEEYLVNNFADSTFENLNLNLVAIVNNNTDLLFCQSFDLESIAKTETTTEIQQLILSDDYIWEFQAVDSSNSGLMIIDNKPMLVATAPILTSETQGPAMGGMLFGKYLDNQAIETLTRLVDFNFTLNTIVDFREKQGNQIADTLFSKDQAIVLKENGPDTISGYTLINDIHSNLVFILEIINQRTIYQQSALVVNIFLAAAIGISGFFGLFLYVLLERGIVKPMRRLAAYAEEISINPSFAAPTVAIHTAEEVTIVTNAVRDTLKRKIEGMNEVSRMVAHDLRNPLSGIKNANYFLKKKYSEKMDERGLLMLQTIDNCVSYSDKIVQNLLDYSSEINLDKIKTSPKAILETVISKLILPDTVKIVNDATDEQSILVDTIRIERVFTNLITNGIDAMQTGGTLRITSKKLKGFVQIDFADTGIGMSKKVLENLWTPFFTTKAKGLGIGLSICKRIIDAHEGRIEVQSVEGKGTCFSVFLPTSE